MLDDPCDMGFDRWGAELLEDCRVCRSYTMGCCFSYERAEGEVTLHTAVDGGAKGNLGGATRGVLGGDTDVFPVRYQSLLSSSFSGLVKYAVHHVALRLECCQRNWCSAVCFTYQGN